MKGLSARLLAAYDMLCDASRYADIGSDHGALAVALARGHGHSSILASDISAPSLEKARRNTLASGVCNMSFEVADGLAAVMPADAGETLKLAICGMGGEAIRAILERGELVARSAALIVMQPMGGEKELREYLYSTGYEITDETVVLDGGRYYQLIAARYTGEIRETPCDVFLEFGRVAYKKRVSGLRLLLEKKHKSRTRRMKRALESGVSPEGLQKQIDEIEQLLSEWGIHEV